MTHVSFNNGSQVVGGSVGYSAIAQSIQEIVGPEMVAQAKADSEARKARQIETAITVFALLSLVGFAVYLFAI